MPTKNRMTCRFINSMAVVRFTVWVIRSRTKPTKAIATLNFQNIRVPKTVAKKIVKASVCFSSLSRRKRPIATATTIPI